MMRALVFAAALTLAPSLPHEVAVVRLNTANASSVAKDLKDIFVRGVTIMPVGQSRLIVVGDPIDSPLALSAVTE